MEPIKPFSKWQAPKSCCQRNKLRKTSSKRQALKLFSNQFNFEVISSYRCKLKFNVFILKIQAFQKRILTFESLTLFKFSNHNCQKIFWTFWILNSYSCMYGKTHVCLKIIPILCQHKKKSNMFLPIQGFQNLSIKFSSIVKSREFQASFTKGKHLEQNISLESSNCLPWELTFIYLCNVKTSSEMSSLYKKDFAWRSLFAKMKNKSSSSSKDILNKEQTFCPPSYWWDSIFSAFFLRV